MARPQKQGLDYFPLDVHLDNKFKFIELKFGLEGFAVVVKIMQELYSNGYWLEFTEDQQELFSGDNRIDLEKLQSILSECLKRGIFNKKIFDEHQVLTSSGIQKRYKLATSRRTNIVIVPEYALIEDLKEVNVDKNPDKPKKPQQEPAPHNPEPVEPEPPGTRVQNANEPFTMDDEPNERENALGEIFTYYGQQIRRTSPVVEMELEKAFDALGQNVDVIKEAIRITSLNGSGYNYLEAIFESWEDKNVKTLDDAKIVIADFKKKTGGAKTSAIDYENA